MNLSMRVLAYRYAHSYLRVYSQDITLEGCINARKAVAVLKNNKPFLALVAAPWVAQEQRCAVVATLFEALELPSSFAQLCSLLGSRQRLSLLPEVIQAVIDLYQKQNALMECVITTAHPLDEEQKAEVLSAMSSRTHHRLIPTFLVDPSLIAGIRFVSATYLWQDTIASRLRRIRDTIFQEKTL